MRLSRWGAWVAGLAIASGSLVSGQVVAWADDPPLLGTSIPEDVLEASSASGSQWTPAPDSYGISESLDHHVRMVDGTQLHADVYYPAGPDGRPAEGPFPVVMTQTPYGRQTVGAVPESVLGSEVGGPNRFLVSRGYISVVADVRGTGSSEGYSRFFDPIEAQDGATLVNWAAKLPHSSGKVGLYGASFLGINQLFTAAAVGKNSPLKAIFPISSSIDIYRDGFSMGGMLNTEIVPAYGAVTGTLDVLGPAADAVQHPQNAAGSLLKSEPQHATNAVTFKAPLVTDFLAGKDRAYDEKFWQDRAPRNILKRVVENDVSAYLVGGEFDILQRGSPLNYVGLQNAWAGRPLDAPMRPDQKTTGRYQLLVGPYGHLAAATADVGLLQLRFDTFLKGQSTGMDHTPTPLHYFDLGEGHYDHHAHYPFPEAQPTRYYLGGGRTGSTPLSQNDGTLSTSRPTGEGADALPWAPTGNPCLREFDTSALGAFSLLSERITNDALCINNDTPGTLGPERLSYTTAPLDAPKTIAGPATMTVYASANTTDTEWVVQLDDVSPDGTSTPLSVGALIGSFRELDQLTTWKDSDGEISQAGHAFTRASRRQVLRGEVTRYDVEVFPTYSTIKTGHRIRVTIASAASNLLPTLPTLPNLIGGIYSVKRGPTNSSALQLQLVEAGQ